jgi:hypothetical protein
VVRQAAKLVPHQFDVLPALVAELAARRNARREAVDLDAERVRRGQM